MQTLRTQLSGRRVRLSATAEGSGGEGTIYRVEDEPDTVAKVYKAGKGSIRKLKAMLRIGPPRVQHQASWPMFAWPTDLLKDQRERVAGFIMPRIRGVSLYSLLWPSRRARDQPNLSRKGLYVIATHLARTLQALHESGHAANDLNASNVFITEQSVVLIDCDSFEIRDAECGKIYICTAGKPKYTPPEFQGLNYRKYRGGQAFDRFALATLVFQLLMEGMHPFAGKYRGQNYGNNTLGSRIAGGQWPYASRTPSRPRPASPPLSILPPPLQKLFRKCFEDGHRDPSLRPSAQRWLDVLAQVSDQLSMCSKGHHYSFHLSGCPWCSR